MALPSALRDYDVTLNVNGAAITGGFTASIPAPTRGEITGVYLAPTDGTAITGSATLTFTVANVAGSTVAMAASAIGIASGTTLASGVTLSARQFCNEGDIIKMVLGAGMTNAAVGILTVVIRTRSA